MGRVSDDDYDALAVLLPDGHLVGTDNRALGYVGLNNATPPFAEQAWLSLQSDGRVVFYEPNGDSRSTRPMDGLRRPESPHVHARHSDFHGAELPDRTAQRPDLRRGRGRRRRLLKLLGSAPFVRSAAILGY